MANFTLCGSKNQFPLTILWCSSIWGPTPPILHPVPSHNFRAGSCGSPAGPLTCTPPPLQLPPTLPAPYPNLPNWGRPSGTLTPLPPSLASGHPGPLHGIPGPIHNSTGSQSLPAASPGRHPNSGGVLNRPHSLTGHTPSQFISPMHPFKHHSTPAPQMPISNHNLPMPSI